MIIEELFLVEGPVEDRIMNDPKYGKMLALAFKHDNTIPNAVHAALGPKPDPRKAAEIWLKLLDKANNNSQLGVISPEKKFYDWATKVYTNQGMSWENFISRGVDNLHSYYLLSRRNLLKPADQDVNRFPSLSTFENAMAKYREQLQKIKEEERLKQMAKDAKIVTIVDNDTFTAWVPLNYGGSCTLSRSTGEFANWCTGTLSSDNYFNMYSKKGPLIVFQSKVRPEDKFQMHAPTNQFKDKKDEEIDRDAFAKKYPNAMVEIQQGLIASGEKFAEIYPNIENHATQLKNTLRAAFGKEQEAQKTWQITGFNERGAIDRNVVLHRFNAPNREAAAEIVTQWRRENPGVMSAGLDEIT
jgi:hypothetical protein